MKGKNILKTSRLEELDGRWEDQDTCLSWESRKTYSLVKYTGYCMECRKKVKHVLQPIALRHFLEGTIDSDTAFKSTISDEDAFLIAFKICVQCNEGYELEEIVAYPGKVEDKK